MTLLEFRDLSEKKGIPFSDTTIWRKINAGEFPKPVKIGRRNCWVEAEIDQYLENLAALREVSNGC
jgi:predicted DNA-binding transcriptional regulator AlpA